MAAAVALALAASLTASPVPVAAQVPSSNSADGLCDPGQPGVIYGTSGADALSGTTGEDVICGLGGNDSINGGGGNDLLAGGDGNDNIVAGAGADLVWGGNGDDSIAGGTGADQIEGGIGNDALNLGDGDDVVDGNVGNDSISGGAGNDGVSGGAGNDSIVTGVGNDVVFADEGNDLISTAEGDDQINAGPGTDTLSAGAGIDLCSEAETASGCETAPPAEPDIYPDGVPIVGVPSARANIFDITDSFPGVSLIIDSAGGVYPWEVEIRPARAHMHDILDVLAGPAYDITVPDTAVINSATLTWPYDESRLGVPEGDAQIWTYDEARQLWVPVAGAQTVDPVTNTVTAQVSHFSVYAVLGINSAWGWEQVFRNTPLRCTGGGGPGVSAFDVAFVIDTSGSMGSNDPTGLRVDGAAAFVDEMGVGDRAAVVTFASSATTVLELTSTATPEDKATIKDGLEAGRGASGGTNISAAVAQATSILAGNGGGPRLRVAILLTDGQSSYNHALTQTAAEAGIEIHTVGLGSGVDAALLQSIATGTGATYRQITDPADLPDLYRELAGDIIGGGLDTDGDGITDCVERNGAFTPTRRLFGSFFPGTADFIATDPENPDTDGDGLDDGAELVEAPLADDPVLAADYDFLVDQGLDTYYRMTSDPTDADTDSDGLDDGLEVLNGTDPLGFDLNELGIDGLDLPPFTLFQPSRYDDRPVLPSRLTYDERDGFATIGHVFYNGNPVRYDGSQNCVETCTAIEDLAVERPNGNGFATCIGGFGTCHTDAEQERDIIEEARNIQGIFDRDGHLTEQFLQEQAAATCTLWSDDADACLDEAADLDFADNINADDLGDELARALLFLPVAGIRPGVGVNPHRIADVGSAIMAAGIVSANATKILVEEALESCYLSKILEVVGVIFEFLHPCDILPTFSPGNESNMTTYTQHNLDAITASPDRALLIYATEPENTARGVPRGWQVGQPGCELDDRADAEELYGVLVACDEMPYYSTSTAGPGASLRYIPRSSNGAGGGYQVGFTNRCYETRGLAAPGSGAGPVSNRTPYLVIPNPIGGPTVSWCSLLR